MIRLTLPLPPSLNQAYRNVPGVGRVKTGETKKWEGEASKWVAIARGSIMSVVRDRSGRVHATYTFHFPDKRKRDIANFEKLLSDLLVKMKIFDDDSQIDRMVLIRGETYKGNPRVEVSIEFLNT